MSRIVVRRAPSDEERPSRFSLSSVFVGLAIGGGLALVAREIWNAAREDRWVPGRPLPRASSIPAIEAAKSALATDPHLANAGLSLLPGGRGFIELHGWVSDRQERARAARLVSAAIAPAELVNSLMVHGEDDGESLDYDAESEAVSA